MEQITPSRLAIICNGTYYGDTEIKDREVSSITTDSREITDGGLFIAIKGTRTDGSRFINKTYESGVLCCISEVTPEEAYSISAGAEEGSLYNSIEEWLSGRAFIQVKSCLQALKDIAEFYRIVCATKIIGITGSVGKTTTKEMIASVLSEHFNTLKTQGNFNNEIGVPLTLFRLREEHELAIVEMGISEFGEMTRLSKIVKPDICVITNIGQCHLENLGDRDGVLKAKTEIFTSMAADGKVYLNGDDDKLVQIEDVNGKKPVFFGTGRNCSVYADNIVENGLDGTYFDAVTCDIRIPLHVPVPGMHMVTNALAAVAVATGLGMEPDEIAAGISKFTPVGGHSSIIKTDRFTIMNDCYNANPVSLKAAIDVLSSVKGRKVAIIGDMFELGVNEKIMHFDIGAYAVKKGIDCIVCAGKLAKEYVAGALAIDGGHNVLYYENTDQVIELIGTIVKDGDSILVKASHAMGFERIVKVLEDCK